MSLADPATRALLGGTLAALAVLVAAPVPATAADNAAKAAGNAPKPAKWPNVVLIVSDDQAVQTVRPDTMPNLLTYVLERGTSFTNAIVTTPLCCPSRASMISGQYGHNNGVLSNNYDLLRKKHNTLPVWLRRAGYRTIHVGKYLNLYRKAPGPEAKPAPGWSAWQTLQAPHRYYDYELSINGRTVRYGTRDSDYLTDVLNRRAVRLVGRYASDRRPFYLQLDHWAPHEGPGRGTGPCGGGADAVPAPADEALFGAEPLPNPPSFDEPDVSDKPSFIQRQPHVNVAAVERNYRCALASLRAVDRGIEMLHSAVKEAGELDSTVFVYVSDNGFFFGEHRLRYKINPYEEALRVPFAIALPPPLRKGAARIPEFTGPVANIDLAPTILKLAGASSCRRPGKCRVMDGRSLLPVLRGAQAGWPRDRAFAVEWSGRNNDFVSCRYRGIRTPDQLFVEHTSVPDDTGGACVRAREVEHYELTGDPFELDNLYPATPGTPAADEERALADRLATLRRCSGIRGRDPRRAGRPYCE